MEDEEVIDNILQKLNFFILDSDMSREIICTYRPVKCVKELFHSLDMYKWSTISQIDYNEIKEIWVWAAPLYCVELHMNYESLQRMAEDIMVYNLSGMMEKEMKGMLNE